MLWCKLHNSTLLSGFCHAVEEQHFGLLTANTTNHMFRCIQAFVGSRLRTAYCCRRWWLDVLTNWNSLPFCLVVWCSFHLNRAVLKVLVLLQDWGGYYLSMLLLTAETCEPERGLGCSWEGRNTCPGRTGLRIVAHSTWLSCLMSTAFAHYWH